MATPNTKATLISYCKRQLGAPVLEINVDDLDFDFEVDNAELLGDITGNVFSTTSSDLQALVPDWVVQEEGSAAAALQELFDSDNFFSIVI